MLGFKSDPDAFVALIPVPWDHMDGDILTGAHGETWLEQANYVIDVVDEAPKAHASETEERAVLAMGSVQFEDGVRARIAVEEPIEQLLQWTGTSKEPFTAAEAVLLKEHRAIWRVSLPGGRDNGLDAARRFAKILSTFVTAQAAGFFLPNILQLHSPQFVLQQTVHLNYLPSLVNLFIGAWDKDNWMMTRGLTAFGLPEFETPVNDGLNSAYFRLLDVTSGMLEQGHAYPIGSRLMLGPHAFTLEEGRQGPEDEQVPISGTFGVLTVRPS